MRTLKLLPVLATLALLIALGCERKVTNEITKVVSPSSAAYIGSDNCGTAGCHETTLADFKNSGHPYKLNEAEDVQQPGYYPYTTVPTPPPGVDWADVDKVIGGFRWKARFIDHDGFIITGDEVQYNLATQEWVPYHSGETKPYKCGPCHMTGYKDIGNQEGKPGLVGTWAFNGVQCEECHGPGELHAADPRNVALKIDISSEGCGKCHIRGDVNKIPASGGFVKHHEQWNEMFTTKHNSLKCVDCHDPHMGLHELNPDREAAIKLKCENCHFEEYATFNNTSISQHKDSPNAPSCIDCHMPKAAKSAVGDLATFTGDVRSHMFRINTDPNAEMFTADGKFANGYLTMEYSCLQCHTDKDKGWAGNNVSRVHVKESGAEETCFSCHSDNDIFLVAAELEWQNSTHASGENTNRNRLDQPYYSACEKCHTHEGFLARPEVTGVPASGDQFSVIGCFTCHAPHSNGNFDLRIETPVDLANTFTYDKGSSNICASCHQSRRNSDTYVVADVNLSSHWGPHHNNQSDMLMGTNGYEFAGYSYVSSAHTNSTVNGCVDCHMDGGNNIFTGGHSFKMEDTARGFENDFGCNTTNCHNGLISGFDRLADGDFDMDGLVEGTQTEVAGLLDSLHVLLEAAGLVDAGGHPISQAVADANIAGALWNFLFVEEDQSHGIHNTDYAVGLLLSAINYMNDGSALPVSDLTVTAGASAPTIDGTVDAVWSSATPKLVKVGENPAYAMAFGQVDVTLRALSFNNTLYMLAQWTDPSGTENINKKRWGYSAGTWSPGSEDEDRFYVMFDGGDNGTEMANCATMCHQPISGSMGTTGGGHVDVWHWKAARTNPGNHVDDKWWSGTGRGSDAKTSSLYTDNTEDIGGGVFKPMYMHSTGTAYTGDFLFDADKVAFDSTLDWTGKTIPYYVINPAAVGSRWDVSAKGVYAGGVWTLEMSRPFNTGNADDVVLGAGAIQITVAVTDNAGASHSGSVPFKLDFGGAFAARR